MEIRSLQQQGVISPCNGAVNLRGSNMSLREGGQVKEEGIAP